jgi:hypothetical protein
MRQMDAARGGAKRPIYSSVTWNQRIYGNIFVDSMSPRNILLYSSVPRNIIYYICRHYVPWLFHRLTKEFTLNLSVSLVNSSVVTDEYIVVSYCVYLGPSTKQVVYSLLYV